MMKIDGGVRRKDKRVWYLALGVFAAVFLFTFLSGRFKAMENTAEAASLAGFNPGFIISDYQMGNYNSMSEAEIQAFLSGKNSCGNSDYNYYLALSANRNYTWHWDNGHFICLSEERFGDGEVIGSGESAAHIIWQTAQDYKINPQVLIALLQKETGLITDPIPNNGDYRKATGFGCPDTAECSSKYYGFKNQVRHAAELFSTVLRGGWTNYPLGNNYIQYNPNAGCGGSVVNIKNLATSALYRYTPYQPNAGALAAGYGTASCGAYGNRNFYLYFEDWFGGVKEDGISWTKMDTPRYMVTSKDTYYYDLYLSKDTDVKISKGTVLYYTAKTGTRDGRMCLKAYNNETNNDGSKCVIYATLNEMTWSWSDMETPRYLQSDDNVKVINMATGQAVRSAKKYDFYNKKIGLPDGRMCLRIKDGADNECVVFADLKEVQLDVVGMLEPRYLIPAHSDAKIIDPIKDIMIGSINNNEKKFFSKKIVTPSGEMCLVVDNAGAQYGCVKFGDLAETWVEMERPREMMMRVQSYKVDATNLRMDNNILLTIGMRRRFVMKRFMPDNTWCLQTEYDYNLGTNNCIRYNELSEI